MALRLKGSYGLALLFTAGIVGWMATGHTVISGEASEGAVPPPAVRNQLTETEAVRVAVQTFSSQERQSLLTIRGRTQSDKTVTVRAETTATVLSRSIEKGQWVEKDTLLCELDAGSRLASLAQAEAALAQAEFDLDAKETLAKKGFAAQTQIEALKAQRDAALAGVKIAKVELARTKVLAPIAGSVQGPLAEVGDQLKSGDACAVLMNPDPMLVVGQVSERDIPRVHVGAKAQVELVTGEKADGVVRYVSTASNIETRTFLIEVEVPNPDRSLRDGVTAIANLVLDPLQAHLMSPAHLTLSDEGIVGVMRVEDSHAIFTPVSILANDAEGVWVGGLPSIVDVITVGQEYVKSGQLIEAVSASSLREGMDKKASLKAESAQ
ncbi:efflux RND transporter periplasmic adaptor subunit [Cohaesibacter celericrescens]|uniref:Efflux RND transporter periplasmic adaptor subunit n=1 Tax=Cohaesibacter celericrescens TaxID=2067669 RepID=A0A2N5XQG2_9HYPH|nr:efflux RND transporter periplasmic adaptor subunit [Cohaesibacter celericrescens]PLW76752.1 efflux RND transporter periplasmic adaptor subunit [Cohaesibacter celericrescens]